MRISDENTLKEARDWLRERSGKGEHCPCCRQYVKVYRRKLNGSMCRMLIAFYRAGRGWHRFDDTANADGISWHGADYGKLAYWELLEPHQDTVGLWRVTDLGAAFVLRNATVQSHANIYDGRRLFLDGDHTGIVGALGRRFNYWELMGENPTSDEPE